MSSTPSPRIFPRTLDDQPPAIAEAEHGLQSSRGIRWLLLVGALLVAVSLLRLMAMDWAHWPPALKALSLIGGSLGLYALGELTRFRLRLHTAGTALLALFSATLPVLAWGAAERQLLDKPFGLPAFLFGWTAVLLASRRQMRLLFDYRGKLYPAALALLLLAAPILPRIQHAVGARGAGFFLLATLLLGLTLRFGSRHLNRFFFHRDRLRGVDRPLHALPFALLAMLFGAAVATLISGWLDLALPLILLAVALVDTGEEVYRAQCRAEGRVEQRWPARSVWLLGLGFGAMAAGMTLALSSGGPLVTLCGAAVCSARLGSWAVRYQKPVAHAAALLCLIAAHHALAGVVSFPLESSADLGRWHLAGLCVLVVITAVARQRRALGRELENLQAVITVLYALSISFACWTLVAPSLATAVLLVVTMALLRRFWIGLVAGGLALLVGFGAPTPVAGLVLLSVGLWRLYQDLRVGRAGEVREPGLPARLEVRIAFGLLLAASFQLMTVIGIRSLDLALLIVGLLLGAGRLGWRRWVGGRLRRAPGAPRALAEWALGVRVWERIWLVAATAVSLLLAGPVTLLLSIALLAMVLWRLVFEESAARFKDLALMTSLLPILQLSALFADARWLLQALATPEDLVRLLALTSLWQVATARSFSPTVRTVVNHGLDLLVASVFASLIVLMVPVSATAWGILFAVAVLRALTHLRLGWKTGSVALAWLWQSWLAVAGLIGLAAGWWTLGGVFTAYAALSVAVGELLLAEFFERRGGRELRRPTLPIAMAAALYAGGCAVATSPVLGTLFPAMTVASLSPWLRLLPVFLASLLFGWLAVSDRHRTASAIFSVTLFAVGLFVLFAELGTVAQELYLLPPGVALLALSRLLEREMGRTVSQWVFTAGALCLYAMPVFGSLAQLSWGWQVVLLLLAVGFGTVSFVLRSPSLLAFSTAAILLDLAFFIVKLRQEAPILIWILGILLGLGLIATAALLEHRRERLLQRLRLWGREVRAWT